MNNFLTAYGVVFLAELPDKTMFATLLLATKFSRKSAVWAGVTSAYSAHVIVAALLGSMISRLPTEPLRFVVSALFVLAGGYLLWSSWRRIDDSAAHHVTQPAKSWWSIFAACAATIGVAEFADITQLATASLAATRDAPVAVGLGSASALASVSGVAVLLGTQLTKRVNLRMIQRAAGVLFVALGLATLL